MRSVVCQRCGKEFTCTGDNKCWCTNIPYVKFEHTVQYNDCICEKCLVELYNETSKNNNQG